MSESSKSMPLIRVLLLIRDARSTRGAQRELLYALALRCQPAKSFVCWPSYDQLALDTGLNVVTLKRAAQKLEASGYIRRASRFGHSNRFFLNIGKIQAEALATKTADAEARQVRKQDDISDAPFDPPILDAAEEDADPGAFDDYTVDYEGGTR